MTYIPFLKLTKSPLKIGAWGEVLGIRPIFRDKTYVSCRDDFYHCLPDWDIPNDFSEDLFAEKLSEGNGRMSMEFSTWAVVVGYNPKE